MQYLFIALWLVSSIATTNAAPLSGLPQGKHCVAYEAKKRLFLINTVKVMGTNCDVSAQVIPEFEDKFYLEVLIPIESFQSGESERDKDVVKLLKANEEPELRFRTKPMALKQWEDLLNNSSFNLQGELRIGRKVYPVTAKVALVETEQGLAADGIIKTKFSDFNLKPPQMIMGLFAAVKQDLTLHFHLLAERTLGASSILP